MLLVRNMPRLLKQFVPPILGFLFGYLLRYLDTSPPQLTSSLENIMLTLRNSHQSFDILISGSSFIHWPLTLLVLIISSPSNSLLRNTIRETWLSVSKKNHNFKAFFVIGERSLNTKQIYDLSQEKFRNNDLMLLPMHDSYGALTSKVFKSFEFSQKNFKFDYLLKCDDDTFVDLEKVVEELKEMNEPSLYWGFFEGRAPVQTKGKWADPQYRLCDKYIPYALGGGYVLGKNLVQYIADNSRMLKMFNSEDASVGTWLAGLKIKRKHDSR